LRHAAPQDADMLWDINQVMEATSLSRRHVYRLMRQGRFPQQANHSAGRKALWRRSDVARWVAREWKE
jgi:predicted DNA-binding transcriptional regulator AlpA